MRDIFQGTRGAKLIDWLKIDSWIDSGLYNSWTRFRDWWSAYSSFFGKFEVKGFVRALNELACEALTLGVGGLLVVTTFALPAFEVAQGKINLSDEYSVTFLDRYGNEIGKRGLLRDDSVPLEEIPDYMIKATLATEDRRFFEHFGVDVMGTFRALAANAQHDTVVQGGSSLTQQLAKNMFLSPERSLSRKIKEAFIAIYLENHYTKAEILKLYFDRAYLGGGSYGVEAAAQYYFGKSIREVNLAEAAMLAGMFKAPTRYAPHVNLAASRARANEVLSNMVEAGYMSEGQVYGARMNPAKIVERTDTNTPDYFLDWAFEEVQRLMKGQEDHILVARTTVDTGLQKMAEDALETTIATSGRARHFEQGAMVVMELDGAVRALVGGKDYGDSQFNRATHAYRQPGSSFKPYVYVTAFETGKYTPNTVVNGSGAACGHWAPKNYSAGEGNRMTLHDALAHSINTIAVKVSLEIGREKVLETMKKLGITRLKKTCSLALGDQGLTPLEHTTNYAVFASGGLEVHSYAIEEIRGLASGEVVYNHDRDAPPRKQIFSRKSVEMLNTMMQQSGPGGNGTGGSARLHQCHRQDGHELELPRCLVHGHHRPIRRRGVARQRRLHADGAGDGRQLPGPDLAQFHGRCARHRQHPADPGHRPASRSGRRAGPPRRCRRTECRRQSRGPAPAPGGERQGYVAGDEAGPPENRRAAERRQTALAKRPEAGPCRGGSHSGAGRCTQAKSRPGHQRRRYAAAGGRSSSSSRAPGRGAARLALHRQR